MKTSVDISDALFWRAKRMAEKRKTTMRMLIEEGLRLVLGKHAGHGGQRFKLKDQSFGHGGLVEGLDLGDWEEIRSRLYEQPAK